MVVLLWKQTDMKWTNMVSRAILPIAIFVSLLTSVRSQQIVDRSVIKDGEPFMLTCNAAVAGVPPASQNIATVELSRKLPSQVDYTKLAQYLIYGPVAGREVQNTPDSSWTVSFTGAGDGTNNRAMAISVLVSPGKCNDAGVYKCNVVYYPIGGGTDSRFKEQNVTSIAGISNMVFSVVPDNSDFRNPTYSEYREGENITITCRVDGPQDLRLPWKRGIKQGFSQSDDRVVSNYPYANDITTTSIPLAFSTCGAYRHISTLKLSPQQVDDDTTYICVVQDNGQEVMAGNLTIGIVGGGMRSQEIVHGSIIKHGVPFRLTCNADLAGVPNTSQDIASVELSRKLSSQAFITLLAQYVSFGPKQSREQQNPPDSLWNFSFTGAGPGSGRNNRAMAINVLVSEGKCSDAGLYKCEVRYFTGVRGTDSAAKQQSFPSEAGIRNMVFFWDPFISNSQNLTDTQYQDGVNLTITCTIDGPEIGLQLQWMVGIKQSSQSDDRVFSNYPNASDITTTSTSLGANTCRSFRYVSTLRFSLNADHDDTMYKCVVLENGQEVMSRNLTIGIDDDNKGGIATISFGLLASIVIFWLCYNLSPFQN